MNPDKKKNVEVVNDDVEELLKAAEDALLLKLNVNAHTVHGISSDLLSNSSLRTKGQENMKLNKKNNTDMVNDEVEELLRAAEDAALLKLNANSHTIHGSSSDLHPDLHERFRALKSVSKNTKKLNLLTKKAPPPSPVAAKVEGDEGEDDLFARFASLKASVPKPSIAPSSVDTETSCSSLGNASKVLGGVDNIDDEDEDEVEKVIRWAKDAARLDPSTSSDEDNNTKEDDNYSDSENSDEDDDRLGKNQKGHQK